MFEFKMPSMGADMENGILVQWNFAVGDRVSKGDIICEIETAKGNIDVEVWESGVITELRVEPGAKVPVGGVMALIDTGANESRPAAGAPEPSAPEPNTPEPSAPEPDTPEPNTPEPNTPEPNAPEPNAPEPNTPEPNAPEPNAPEPNAPGPSAGLLASPAARQLARDLGVDLATVQGSGPGGAIKLADVQAADVAPAIGRHPDRHHRHVTPVARRMADEAGLNPDSIEATGPYDSVTKADVERALAEHRSEATDTPEQAAPADPLRDAIAKAMSKSKREIPHYYLKTTVDVTETVEWLTEQNEDRPLKERLVFGALLARAVGLAAAEVPEMNGFYEDGFRHSEAVHLGFAVAMRGGGVVAPALHDVPNRSLDDLMSGIRDLVRRVRSGKLRSSEMTDSTITLTSLGELGVDSVFGIIYPPQVAIVGAGSPREVAVAHDGMVGVRTCIDLTLSADHRVSDGITGAKFLQTISRLLQSPEDL